MPKRSWREYAEDHVLDVDTRPVIHYHDALKKVRCQMRDGVRDVGRRPLPRTTRTSDAAARSLSLEALMGIMEGLAEEVILRAAPGREVQLARAIGEHLITQVEKRMTSGAA